MSFGKGGDMVNQMRRRFEQTLAPSLARGEWSHVIVFGGVNDLYSDETAGRTVAKIQKDLTAMYAAARAHGATVVALTVAPWGGFERYYSPRRAATTRALNEWIAEQRRAGHVDHIVDAYTLLSCGDPERLCPEYQPPFKDGLHFGAGGHARLGEQLYAQVFQACP